MINDVTEANETKCETEDFESNGVEKNSFHPSTVYNAEMKHGFNVENNRSSERRIVNDDIYTQFGPEQLFVVELPDNSDQVCLNKDLNFISTNETLIHIEAHDNNTISDEAIEHLKSIDSTNVHKPITTSDTATDFINNGKKAGNEEAVNDALVAKINTFQINFSANERDDTNIVRSYTGESANYTCYHNTDMKSVVVIENKESLEQRSVESEEVFNLELSDNSYQNSLTKDSQDISRNDSSINGNKLEEDMPPSDSKELLSKQSKCYNDETLIHATFYDNQIISDEAIEHSKSIDFKNVQETLTACGTNSDCVIHDNNISQRKCPTANKKISVSEFTEKQRYYTSSRQKSPVLTNSGKVDYTKKNDD
ncbi:hypothetical protein DPMN_188076 [Dreissena polymorpha]|uniref:Uncharacterized protein n=1 Tax=Dreissena polymorpha TaxID=45954 RepID=A0A9D4DS91_DREPO|nr:hypothetical protein DPMN_188076 [Dreissena polymorpha]